MKAYIIDDEKLCIDDLAWMLSQYPDITVTGTFTDPLTAFSAMQKDRPDIVFLDIDMPRMHGLELTGKIQARYGAVMIVFVTAHAQYALEAFKAYPMDFLLKPVDDRLQDTVAHLRRQYALLHPDEKAQTGLTLRCFGAFEVCSATTIHFATRRAKELLLYLISRRGASATPGEIVDALFDGVDDRNTRGNLYVTLSRLKTFLECLDPSKGLIRLSEDNALRLAPGICDYTDFMDFAARTAVISMENAPEAEQMLNLCRGLFLEKENVEWALESSQDAELEYERISLGLGRVYAAAGRSLEAENALLRLLNRNPLSAEGYEALLSLYMKEDNTLSFTMRYEEFVRMLRKEFRIKPPAVYQNYYTSFKKS